MLWLFDFLLVTRLCVIWIRRLEFNNIWTQRNAKLLHKETCISAHPLSHANAINEIKSVLRQPLNILGLTLRQVDGKKLWEQRKKYFNVFAFSHKVLRSPEKPSLVYCPLIPLYSLWKKMWEKLFGKNVSFFLLLSMGYEIH